MPFLDVGDAQIAYATSGAGRPHVVFVHGAFCDHRDWQGQTHDAGGLPGWTAVDLRGHGQSTGPSATCTIEQFADDVNALIDHLQIAPSVLVGHSLGYRVVVTAAARRPENARGLVLLDGSRMFAPSAAAATSRPAALSDEEVVRKRAAIIAEAIGSRASLQMRSAVAARMSSASPDLARAVLETLQDWDEHGYRPMLAALQRDLPILAVQSTFVDAHIARSYLPQGTTSTPFLDDLRTIVPWLQTLVLPDTGHFSMLEAPSRVAEIIRRFVASDRQRAALTTQLGSR
jgi:pimeloyl-ACP methyl ester carboxylesterase